MSAEETRGIIVVFSRALSRTQTNFNYCSWFTRFEPSVGIFQFWYSKYTSDTAILSKMVKIIKSIKLSLQT